MAATKKAAKTTKKTAPKAVEAKESPQESIQAKSAKEETVSTSTEQVQEVATPKVKATSSAKPTTMAELLAHTSITIVVPQQGQTVKGTVLSKDKRTLVLDINAKTRGVVSDREYDLAADFINELKEGDEIEAYVLSTDNDRGQVALSLKQAAVDAQWDYFQEALDNDETLSAHGVEVNKGGLIVEVAGTRGFVPSSQFGKQYMGKFDQLKGQDFQVKVIEVEREKNRLIFSERHVSEAGEIANRDRALKAVASGEIYEGVVSGVMHFGLFVTVEVPVDGKTMGHVEGLVHISEISWEKVNHPRDYHQVGDRIKVKVLGVDEHNGKLNLSIKQLSDDPWQRTAEEFPAGTTLTGTVTRVESFGVFIRVETGIDGLIHSSKLEPDQTYTEGEEVSVVVESVDAQKRRMSLSPVLTEVPMGYK